MKNRKKSCINLITLEQIARQLQSCIKSCLYQKRISSLGCRSRALCQVHTLAPQKINQPYYDAPKPIEQHHFDLSYVPYMSLKGTNTSTC